MNNYLLPIWMVSLTILFLSLSGLTFSQKFNPASITTNGTVQVMEQDSLHIYIGGSFTSAGYRASGLANINEAQNVNPEFPNLNGTANVIIDDGKGGYYVGGHFLEAGKNHLMRLFPDYTIDPNFTPNPNNSVHTLFLDGETLYVGGVFTQVNGQPQNRLAAVNASNGNLHTWNPYPGPDVGRINSIVKEGNLVYVGGDFHFIGGRKNPNFAIIDATTGLAIQSVSSVSAVSTIVLDEGNIYLGGAFNGPQGIYTGPLSLFQTNSDLPDFNFPILDSGEIFYCISDGNGGWYVGGTFQAQGKSNLIRILADQTIDNNFAPNPNGKVNALFLDGNTLYAGGHFTQISGQNQNRLASLNATNGSLNTWNPLANETIHAILKVENTVYVCGDFTNIGGQNRSYFAAIDAASAQATTWNPNPGLPVYSMAVFENTIIAAGAFQNIGGQNRPYLAAIELNTGLATAWNPQPNDRVETLHINGESVFVGGSFSTIGGQARKHLAEVSLSTANATSWNPNVNSIVNSILVVENTVYFGGYFSLVQGEERNYLAAVDKTTASLRSWNPLPSLYIHSLSSYGNSILVGGYQTLMHTKTRRHFMALSKTDRQISSFNPLIYGSDVTSIALVGETAFIIGSFYKVGDQERSNTAQIRLDNGMPTSWNPGVNRNISIIRTLGDELYLGVQYDNNVGYPTNHIATVNKQTGTLTSLNIKPNSTVNDIIRAENGIIIVGMFTMINAEARNNLLAISKSTGSITNWHPNVNANVAAIEINGDHAYVGGSFTTSGGLARNNIAEVSLTTGSTTAWNPGANSTITSMKKFGDNLYVSGNFSTIGGQTRRRLAALNITDGSATSWDPNANNLVTRLALSDSILYVSGNFTEISGQIRNRLASYNVSDFELTAWNPNISGPVNDIFVTGSTIFIGGSFNMASGKSRSNLASYSKLSGNITTWRPLVNSTVTALVSKGKNVFVGGSFNLAAGKESAGFAVFSTNTTLPNLFFPIVSGGQIRAFSIHDNKVYIGGTFNSINYRSFPGLVSLSYPDGFYRQMIDDFNPKSGGNIGTTTVTILGDGFIDGTRVRLSHPGQTDIPMTAMYISDGYVISGEFDLFNRILGKWDLIVEIPGDTTLILKNSFEIAEGKEPVIWTDIIGFDVIRPLNWQSYNLMFGYEGNVDAIGVPIWLAISEHAEIKLNFDFQPLNDIYPVEPDAQHDSIPEYYIMDTVMDYPGPFKLVGIFVPSITNNESNSISFSIRTESEQSIEMISWADQPYFGSPLKPNVAECYNVLFDLSFSFNPTANCINNSFNSGYQGGASFAKKKNGQKASGSTGFYFATPQVISSNLSNCASGISTAQMISHTAEIIELLNHSLKSRSARGEGTADADAILPCVPPSFAPTKRPPILVVNSFDPNDKMGPYGEKDNQFANLSKTLPYVIRFENIETAAAAAQKVIIIDSLDMAVYDLSTFQLGAMSIADTIFSVPPGLKSYETQIDLRPGINIIADIQARLDMTSGIARWEFTSLDPATLLPTILPLAGFLPPNINQPEGEGSVLFSIKIKDNLTAGSVASNKASIFFDFNEPIITNNWFNTHDNVKPISSIIPIQPSHVTDSVFTINWSGTDEGSGVRYYDIYYAVRGESFKVLITSTVDTTLQFHGKKGLQYDFFSISTDWAGNIENMKSVAEAGTSLQTGIDVSPLPENTLTLSLFPNPSGGRFVLSINSTKGSAYNLVIVNTQGSIIKESSGQLHLGENTIPVSIDNSGIYLVLISTADGRSSKKVLIKHTTE
jgi:hypothetical protein